ncbi:hypothetical protein YYC_03547 [Plasmodium yoelii 17X]|uniref:Plasmodium RESA N-terminal domain-containing protein n=1 Tax=Plasmodium yoelii 17X TaxID=1323249 RepID=V7PK88_PLAYE|nr:hypothetical protein YYC_03547 [Plasmodium yoelii 17X]
MSYKKLIFLIVFILALSIKNVDSVIIISPVLNFFDKIFGVKRIFNGIRNVFKSKKTESSNNSEKIKNSNNLSDKNNNNNNGKSDVTEKTQIIGPDHELYQKILNRYITTQEEIDNKIIKEKEEKEKEEELNKLWYNKIKNFFFKKKEIKMPLTLIEYISDKNKKILELELKADNLLSKCRKYKTFFFGTTILLILLSSFPFLLYSYVDYINDGDLTTRFNKMWNRNTSILEEKEKYHNSFEYKVHKRIKNYRSSTYFKMLDLNVSLSEIDGIIYLQLSF